MENVIEYKGYLGKFGYEEGDDFFHGAVLNIRDVIHFQGKSIEDLRQSFQDSVDDYLIWCAEEGRLPEASLSISGELRRKISTRAQSAGISLNQWITDTLEKATAATD